jgi:hypothetical protein
MKNIAVPARNARTLDGVDLRSEGVRRERRPLEAVLMAEVNAHVRELADRLDGTAAREALWGFRCECGDGACREPVPLPLGRYEWLKRRGEPLLAPGHSAGVPPAA